MMDRGREEGRQRWEWVERGKGEFRGEGDIEKVERERGREGESEGGREGGREG